MKDLIIKEGGQGRRLTAGQLEMDKPGGGVTEWVPLDDVKLNSLYATESGEYLPDNYGISRVIVSVFTSTPFIMGYDPLLPGERIFVFPHDGRIYEFTIPDNFPDLTITPFVIQGLDFDFEPIEEIPLEIITIDPEGDLVEVEIPLDLVDILPDYMEDLYMDDIVDIKPIIIATDPETDQYAIVTPDDKIPFPYDVIDPDGNIMDKLDVTELDPMETPITGIDANGNEVKFDGKTVISVPSKIAITTPIRKLDGYVSGEEIDYTGMVVQAFNRNGEIWENEKYPGGVIPFEELEIDSDFDPPAGKPAKQGRERAFITRKRGGLDDGLRDYSLVKCNEFEIAFEYYEVRVAESAPYGPYFWRISHTFEKCKFSFPEPVYAALYTLVNIWSAYITVGWINEPIIYPENVTTEQPKNGTLIYERIDEYGTIPRESRESREIDFNTVLAFKDNTPEITKETRSLSYKDISYKVSAEGAGTYRHCWGGSYTFSRYYDAEVIPGGFAELVNGELFHVWRHEDQQYFLKLDTSVNLQTPSYNGEMEYDAYHDGESIIKRIIYDIYENGYGDDRVIYVSWPRPDGEYLDTEFSIRFAPQ